MKLLKTISQVTAVLVLSTTATTTFACSSDGYIGTLNIFAGNFPIRSCAFAQGQILSINSNQSLFSILGATYGGDGRTTFALPDTRGRAVIGVGNGPGLSNITLGQKGGAEQRVLNITNMPSHNHAATTTVSATAVTNASSAEGDTDSPNGNVWAVMDRENIYSSTAPNVTMSSSAVTVSATATTTTSNTGNNSAFSIRDPYIGMHWLIQLYGVYPPRS